MKKCVLIAFLAICPFFAGAQAYNVHSVYLFSFTKYIIWPDEYNQGDFEILVLGESPIVEHLENMAKTKKVGERTIKVSKISNTSEIRKCNILFVSTAKSADFAAVQSKIGTQSILLVTEEPGLGVKGSNINFVMKDGKLAFELNQTAIAKQNFKIASELMRFAILI